MRQSAARQTVLRLERDMLIIFAAILCTIVAVRSGMLDLFLAGVQEEQYALASFVAGIFCTSVFTIAPAAIVLVHIGSHTGPVTASFFGALGAMLGDVALFLFVRDVFAADLESFLKAKKMGRFFHYLRMGKFKWFAPIVGAFIIASPLPDELGLALLGFSRMPLLLVLPLTFVLNFVGILLLILAAAHL